MIRKFSRLSGLGRSRTAKADIESGSDLTWRIWRGSSFRMIKALCPDSPVLEGFSTKGGLERDGVKLAIQAERREEVRAEVIAWLWRIQML